MTTSRDLVVQLLQDSKGIEFSGSLIRQLMGPIVYVVFRSDQAMYVGMSRQGVGRFSPQHKALVRIEEGDSLQCFSMPDALSARRLESLLISRLRPAWNIHGILGTTEALQSLGEQLGITARRARSLVAGQA